MQNNQTQSPGIGFEYPQNKTEIVVRRLVIFVVTVLICNSHVVRALALVGNANACMAWLECTYLAMFRISYKRPGYVDLGHVQKQQFTDVFEWNCREPPVLESFLNKATVLRPVIFLKTLLHWWLVPCYFGENLRASFLQNTSGGLLLICWEILLLRAWLIRKSIFQRDSNDLFSNPNLVMIVFHLIDLLKDTLKAFDDFKNEQKSVWSKVF